MTLFELLLNLLSINTQCAYISGVSHYDEEGYPLDDEDTPEDDDWDDDEDGYLEDDDWDDDSLDESEWE